MDDTIAGRTCSHFLNDEFSESENGNIKRYFIEIRRGPFPVETIKVTPKTGIKKYHCVYMNISRALVQSVQEQNMRTVQWICKGTSIL